MGDDALYLAARRHDLATINVRRPITAVVCKGVRKRACDYRHVVASLAKLPDPARQGSCLPEPSFRARRLQAHLEDAANVLARLAFKDG
jgi:hypothetical protein